MVTQMAAVAELEAGLISERTKQALQAAKARGQQLGNPNLAAAREIALMKARNAAEAFRSEVVPIIQDIQASGVKSFRGIARILTAKGVATARGGVWTAYKVVEFEIPVPCWITESWRPIWRLRAVEKKSKKTK